VFFSGDTQAEWEIYYTNNRGGSWARARRISLGDDTEQRNPDIAIGRDGQVHVVFQRNTGPGRNQIWYVASPDRGATWGAAQNISNSPTRAYEPAVTVDANNAVHAAWIDSRWTGVLQTTYAQRAAGGAWSAPVKIGGNQFERGVALTTTGRGANVQVHVVFMGRKTGSNSQVDYDVWYATGAGGQWGRPSNFSRDSGTWSLEPTITSDGDQALFLAWDTKGNYHDIAFTYSANAGASWAPRRVVFSAGTPSLTPSLGYGLLNGTPAAHLAWSEGDTGRRSVFYLAYDPASNRFASKIERASDSGTLGSALAASRVSNEVSVAYRNKSLRSVVASRGSSAFIGATITLTPGSEPARTNELKVALSDAQGQPTQLRYAFDRSPNDADAWQPFQPNVSIPVPAAASCQRSFALQFRTADGRTSQVFTRSLQIDNAVQAAITLQGTQNPLADPLFTPNNTAWVQVTNTGECAGLSSLSINDQSPVALTNQGFAGAVPLPGGDAEGPRAVTLRVTDALGNQSLLTRTITIDRTPPVLRGGRLEIAAPSSGLPSVLATLRFSDVATSDNLYAGGRWGVLIANLPVSATQTLTDTSALPWRTVPMRGDGPNFQLANWSVLSGLTTSVADRGLAGQQVRVLVKLLDGAGNRSTETLSTTVQLARDYSPVEQRLPVLATP
jgi:hypothetical protein